MAQFQLGFWSKYEQNCTNVLPVMLHLLLVPPTVPGGTRSPQPTNLQEKYHPLQMHSVQLNFARCMNES
ncbi:unnamed protein product [Tenebrio molitor]|nr:unnamed protein product [Tenebrio molitor]